MPHELGTRLNGSLASVDDMRQRCVIDKKTGCWHLRSANGKPWRKGQRVNVWMHTTGKTTPARRAMWAFSTGAEPPADRIVYLACASHDCVRPEHLRCGTKADECAANAARGAFRVPSKVQAARATGISRRTITAELRVWAMESRQSGVAVAHALGCSQGRVNAIRAEARKRLMSAAPSVFAFGAAMNHMHSRCAA